MKNNKTGFTLVELIVVITIVSILSTVGFVSYVDYLKGARDSNRIQQLSELHNAFSLYATRSKLPLPNNGVSVVSGANHVGTQGIANTAVLDEIKYSDGGKDPKTKDFFTYFVSKDRKTAQLLAFFEEDQALSISKQTYADYSILYPYVYGTSLGVLIDSSTQTPIQELEQYTSGGAFDILTQTGSYTSIFTNTESVTGSGQTLLGMVPNTDCKKLLSIIPSLESGVYKINPSGIEQIDVYCDMETDGGGWTFVGHIDNDTNGPDISFNSASGDYSTAREDTHEYYMLDASKLYHEEMMLLFNTSDPQYANDNNAFVQFKYEKLLDAFYMGPLIPCSNFFGSFTPIFYYKTSINDSYVSSSQSACNSSNWIARASDGTYIFAMRDYISGDGNGTGVRYAPQLWDSGSSAPHTWGNDAWIYVR